MNEQVTPNRVEDNRAGQKPDKEAMEWLVHHAMTGDRDALTELCTAIARSVLFRVSCRVPNQMDAEDTAQEVLIRVCRNIGDLSDAKAFGGWLNSIITNETRRHMAKSTRQAATVSIEEYEGLELEEEDTEFLPDDYVIREEDRKIIMAIVRGLPERQLEAVMLHYYEGMNVTETAAAMGIAKPSVVQYLALAREKIKAELQKRVKDTDGMYSITLLPVGGLLTQVLRQEAALMPPFSLAPVEQAMEEQPDKPLNKMLSPVWGVVLSIAAALGFAVAAGVLLVGNAPGPQNGNPAELPAHVRAESVGTVAFSGGVAGYEHLNPRYAEAQAGNQYGVLTELGWKIVAEGSGDILYSSEETDVDAALADLWENGTDGEYWIVYALKDTLGSTYSLSRSFIIRHPVGQTNTE